MSNEIKIFSNEEFGNVRVSTDKMGEPIFCLKDICEILDLKQASKVKERLSEKGVHSIPTLTQGGKQNLLYINESNLYRAIFQSRKPNAERFQDWVTDEVLPSIRKNGGYIANQENLSDLELLAKALLVSNNIIQEKSKQIEDLSTNNRVLAEEVLEWTDRAVLNKAIRILAVKTNCLFYEAWNMLYDELLYKHKINLKRRGKSPYIQHIREDEYSKVFSTLVALFEENGLNFAELIRK